MSKDGVLKSGGVQSEIPFDQYSFPFENLVFEDGARNLLAYIGAVRCLEEAGISSRIQRLAGAGSGAVLAALLSVGYTSKQLQQFFQPDLDKLTHDHCCGLCCIGCSMKSSFGWNSDKRMEKWIGGKLNDVAGKPNLTFLELYEKFGKELCVVVTNVSRCLAEYCHVKTTPDLAVCEAVRMSLASPGLFSPVKKDLYGSGSEEFFGGGGMLCGYPIHCYDGWWLSMRSDDSFLSRLSSVSDYRLVEDAQRFGKLNSKTLGFVMYDDTAVNVWTSQLEERSKLLKETSSTNSNLAKYFTRVRFLSQRNRNVTDETYASYTAAARKFLEMFTSQVTADMKKSVNKQQLDAALKINLMKSEDLKALFDATTADHIWKQMKPKKSDQSLTGQEFVLYFERKCLTLRNKFQQAHCVDRSDDQIKQLTTYLEAVNQTLLTNGRRNQDVERTIGINVCVFNRIKSVPLEPADHTFLTELGHESTRSFLEQYVNKSLPPMKDGPNRRSFVRDDLAKFIDDEVSEIIDERDYMENLVGRVL